MFEAQQINIELAPDAPLVNLPTDAGSVHALRIIDRLLEAEAATPVPTPTAGWD